MRHYLLFCFITFSLTGCLGGGVTDSTNQTPPEFLAGLEVARAIEEQIGLADNPAEIKRLNDIGFTVSYQANSSHHWYSFHIIDLPQPNALAIPGGFVFVTSGLIDLKLTDDEMAVLLGHELSHIEQKHHLRQAKEEAKLSIAQIIATLLVARGSKNVQATEAAMLSSSILHSLLTLSYTRELESEADEYGLNYSVQAGYKPEGGITLLEKLLLHSDEYGGDQGVLFRTHPYLTERIKEIKMRLPHLKNDENQSRPGGANQPTLLSRKNKFEAFRRDNQEFFYRQLLRIQSVPPKRSGHSSHQPLEMIKTTVKVLRLNIIQSDPNSPLALEMHWQFFLEEIEQEEKKPYLMRNYGLLLEKYNTVFKDFSPSMETEKTLDIIKSRREALEAEKKKQYDEILRIMDRPAVAVSFLEQFLENYPQSERFDEVCFRLGDSYEAGGEFDQAAGQYLKIIKKTPAGGATAQSDNGIPSQTGESRPNRDEWGKKSADKLQNLVLKTSRLEITYEIYQKYLRPEARPPAAEYIKQLIAKSENLEECGEFSRLVSSASDRGPADEFQSLVKERINRLAEEVYSNARGYQALGQLARARAGYRMIIKSAPQTDWATRAQQQLKLLQ